MRMIYSSTSLVVKIKIHANLQIEDQVENRDIF